MQPSFYDTNRAVAEYLLFHYGMTEALLPRTLEGSATLDFPVRCVSQCLDLARLPSPARALDLGCAVGRATFELARHCTEVVGIDFSQPFIRTANHLRTEGSLAFDYLEEGELSQPAMAGVPAEIDRTRVGFEQGNAEELRADLGTFDVVLMANLIDRVSHPRRCLERLPDLVRPGGQLILTSPYTWLTEYTAREEWLGGLMREGRPVRTLETLREILHPAFELVKLLDLPFLLREHARKYQLSSAQASVWRRR